MNQFAYAVGKSNGRHSHEPCSIASHTPSTTFDSGNSSLAGLDHKLIGNSIPMRLLKRAIQLVANSEETVLITGETGTGKELIAHAVHDFSPRQNGPYLAVNCGALTESLLESELFGHVKGAFTGATTNKKGFFEAANGGTILLDEFAEMSQATQQRFLRVLQEGTVRPLGSTEPREIKIDTRVVVATNHDLRRDISEGKFRHDLYYRVNVLPIHSPALRDRREDIFPLALHFIRQYNDKNSSKIQEQIPPAALRALEAYSWPGNVRELENIIKRLALCAADEGVMSEAFLRTIPEFAPFVGADLMNKNLPQPNPISRKFNLISGRKGGSGHCQCTEQLNLYHQLLDEAGGNVAEAARQLNIPRTTLRQRILSLQRRCSS